jgi:hypoxanthine phosphoribosyltransferase
MKLKQELKLKMSLKQVMKLVQKLWPQLTLQLGQRLEARFNSMLKNDYTLRTMLPRFLVTEPTALQLQQAFPQTRALFNEVNKQRDDYGSSLRLGLIMAPMIEQKMSIILPVTNWSLVKAFDEVGEDKCEFEKKPLPGLERLSLDARLEKIDKANEVFRYHYVKYGKKFYKIPLLRDRNVSNDDIAVRISAKEYKRATRILEKAGGIQRIVRAIPYSEIRQGIINRLEQNEVSLEDVVVVGIDRGGRIPTLVVRSALGKELAYFMKVDQGGRGVDMERLDLFIKKGIFRDKFILFVDSTVDSGRQINALDKYFGDEDLRQMIGHVGWLVVGSNEHGHDHENHLNINWGVDPDKTFEDNPKLMGVDYGRSNSKVIARPSRISSILKRYILEVPKGIVLETEDSQKKEIKRKTVEVEAKTIQDEAMEADTTMQSPILLIIGDGKNVTMNDDEARSLALKVEGNFRVFSGTPNGNPGRILNLVSDFNERKGATLIQPEYARDSDHGSRYEVLFEGITKEEFRDRMIDKAEVVIAIGGNIGTLKEITKAVRNGKPTIIVRGCSYAAREAEFALKNNKNLIIVKDLAAAVEEAKKYKAAA